MAGILLPNDTSRPQNRVTLVAFLVITFGLIWACFWMMAPYLLSVLMGGILALILRPVFRQLIPKLGRTWAAVAATLGVALLVITPVLIFGALALSQAIETARGLSVQPDLSLHSLSRLAARWDVVRTVIGNTTAVEEQAREAIKSLASSAPGVFLAFFGSLPELVLQLVLALISCYFFLIDGTALMAWVRPRLPLDAEVRITLFNSFKDTAVSTLAATLTAASVQTVIVVTGFLVLGVPAAFLAGGATFIFAWVPLVGSSPVWIAAMIYLFTQGRIPSVFAMLGVGILTGISDNFVYPHVLKGRAQMHSLVSLVAIFGGIHFFGLLGVFIGPILASLLVAVLNIWPVVAERFGFVSSSALIER